MKIDILTIFPEAFDSVLNFSMIKIAREKGKVEFNTVNIRDFAADKHKTTDDVPYGGLEGMVMKIEPLVKALQSVKPEAGGAERGTKTVLLSAAGRKLTQKKLEEYAGLSNLVLICGRYEGVDERLLAFVDEEICIGDFVLSGGEFAALAVIEGVIRLIPGVLGNEDSSKNESFTSGILDYPHYTKPREFNKMAVPDILVSGDHAKIKKWRRMQALRKTAINRPDILENTNLTEEEKRFIEEVKKGEKENE
jgi:tRNA (guanine37-N1)-methyltransferase